MSSEQGPSAKAQQTASDSAGKKLALKKDNSISSKKDVQRNEASNTKMESPVGV